jgi:hypothetical protein
MEEAEIGGVNFFVFGNKRNKQFDPFSGFHYGNLFIIKYIHGHELLELFFFAKNFLVKKRLAMAGWVRKGWRVGCVVATAGRNVGKRLLCQRTARNEGRFCNNTRWEIPMRGRCCLPEKCCECRSDNTCCKEGVKDWSWVLDPKGFYSVSKY